MTIEENKKKIGRNDPCPCGSGKKYKNCCLDKKYLSLPKQSSSELDRLKLEFANYDQYELIATLSGLQVYPEDHSHTIRLEVATRVACSIKDSGERNIEPKNLHNILNKYLPANGYIGIMEDPLENLFTDNIIFYGGNYVVYPGITAHESFILRILFRSIFHFGKNLPKEFKEIVKATSLSLLSLSNEVANRLCHSRYMDSPDKWREDIEVPNADKLNRLSKAIIFTRQKIDELLGPMGLDFTFLSPFIIQVGDQRLLEEDSSKNTLFMRPLVELNDNIIVALPGSLMGALRNFIWVISQKYNLKELIAKKFRKILWVYVLECLRLMFFKPVQINLPTWEENLPVEEGIFRIDTNKLAYVQLVVDDASDYKEEEPYGTWKTDALCENINKRREQLAKWLIKEYVSSCKEIFLITVIGDIARHLYFGFKKSPDKTRTLLINAKELEVVTQLRDCDNLTLWKYSCAEERLLNFIKGSLSPFSFLDNYALYLDCNHSFNLTDKALPDYIKVIPGCGRSLRIKAARLWDIHAALRDNPPYYITVCRRYEDENIPIYFPEGAIGRSFEQLVEGYAQPIWVEPKDKPEEISNALIITYFEITEMFSYWLWQLTPNLSTHLKPLGPNPIHVLFRLENPKGWDELPKMGTDKIDSLPNFRTEICGRSIVLTIPESIKSYFQRADNQGERLIINALMQSFGDMLAIAGQPNSLDEVERNRILDTHAPIGSKKKIFVIKTKKHTLLNPQDLPKLRKLQEHDIEEQLDRLVEELGEKAPPKGKVPDEERTKLCGEIVNIYLQRLRSNLRKFYWKSILEQLIGYNEAIWHERAFKKLTIPTTIECFSDLQSYAKKIAEELPEINSTALTMSTLIEIVVAEPPKGGQIVGMDELDKLLAITYHFVNWAMLSDYIHLGIFDPKISILGSGRVGVERAAMEDILYPFLKKKTYERIESAIADFQSHFEFEYDQKEIDFEVTKYDAAFKAEFGISIKNIAEFLGSLVFLGFEHKTAAPNLSLSKLKIKLKEVLKWSDAEIFNAIKLFSLAPRERWDKAPDGFDAKADIWPWRYNRRLAYLRRPIIIGPEPKEDPLVFWGSRHTETAGKYLLFLVTNGSYRFHEDSSEEMKALIGSIRDKAGKDFNNKVKKWFEEKTDWKVNSGVSIMPGGKLDAEVDLGDIDVLAIDEIKRRIFSIECKNITYGRNPRQIANEIERLIGEESSDSWIKKHHKRDEWINNNIIVLSSVYKLKLESFKICSFILTSVEIPATYIRDMLLPCVSFTRLRREGVRVLDDF